MAANVSSLLAESSVCSEEDYLKGFSCSIGGDSSSMLAPLGKVVNSLGASFVLQEDLKEPFSEETPELKNKL